MRCTNRLYSVHFTTGYGLSKAPATTILSFVGPTIHYARTLDNLVVKAEGNTPAGPTVRLMWRYLQKGTDLQVQDTEQAGLFTARTQVNNTVAPVPPWAAFLSDFELDPAFASCALCPREWG